MQTTCISVLAISLCLSGGRAFTGENTSPEEKAWEDLYNRCRDLKGQRLKGARLKEAGEALELCMRSCLDLLKSSVEGNNPGKASAIAKKAISLFRKTRDPRLCILKAVDLYSRNLEQILEKIHPLEVRLEINPDDRSAREELVKIHIGELDDPKTARGLLSGGMGEELIQHVRLASRNPDQLTGEDLLKLAAWYRNTFGPRNAGTLLRARECCRRYLQLLGDQKGNTRVYQAKYLHSEIEGLLNQLIYSRLVEAKVLASKPWNNICDVKPGEFIDIYATGKWSVSREGNLFGADGPGHGGHGRLQARIADGARFITGKAHLFLACQRGRLQMGMDDDEGQFGNNRGSLTVTVRWLRLTATGACSSRACILKLLGHQGSPGT